MVWAFYLWAAVSCRGILFMASYFMVWTYVEIVLFCLCVWSRESQFSMVVGRFEGLCIVSEQVLLQCSQFSMVVGSFEGLCIELELLLVVGSFEGLCIESEQVLLQCSQFGNCLRCMVVGGFESLCIESEQVLLQRSPVEHSGSCPVHATVHWQMHFKAWKDAAAYYPAAWAPTCHLWSMFLGFWRVDAVLQRA